MDNNFFVSASKSPPARWKIAFPKAKIFPSAPKNIPTDCIVWLHNPLSTDARPAGIRFVVLHDEPDAENDAAWAEEVERRLAEIRSGKVKPIPGEEVMARGRKLVGL